MRTVERSGVHRPRLRIASIGGDDFKIVTTATVTGMDHEILQVLHNLYPAIVLSISRMLRGRTLADVGIRGMKTLCATTIEADANAWLATRAEVYLTRNKTLPLFLYGTLALCE